eukprot:778643_1
MANKKTGLPAGYGNGGIDTMDQCAKLSNKCFKKSGKISKRPSTNIEPIKTNHTKQRIAIFCRGSTNTKLLEEKEQNRRIFVAALQTKTLVELDKFITTTEDQRITLMKRNKNTQQSFIQCKKETAKQKQIAIKEWKKLEQQIQNNDQAKKRNKLTKIRQLTPTQDKC